MEQEQLYTKELFTDYNDSANAEADAGEHEEALKLAKKSLKTAEICMGNDSDDTKDLVD
jgi:hypothetical protein